MLRLKGGREKLVIARTRKNRAGRSSFKIMFLLLSFAPIRCIAFASSLAVRRDALPARLLISIFCLIPILFRFATDSARRTEHPNAALRKRCALFLADLLSFTSYFPSRPLYIDAFTRKPLSISCRASRALKRPQSAWPIFPVQTGSPQSMCHGVTDRLAQGLGIFGTTGLVATQNTQTTERRRPMLSKLAIEFGRMRLDQLTCLRARFKFSVLTSSTMLTSPVFLIFQYVSRYGRPG